MDVLYPDMVNTYSFNIEREGSAPHSIDRRIAATAIDILTRFFDKVVNAMSQRASYLSPCDSNLCYNPFSHIKNLP